MAKTYTWRVVYTGKTGEALVQGKNLQEVLETVSIVAGLAKVIKIERLKNANG